MPEPAPLPGDAAAGGAAVRVGVLDPRRLVAEGVRALLAADPRLAVTADGGDGCDVVVLGEGAGDGDVCVPDGVAVVRLAQVGDVDALPAAVLAAAGGAPLAPAARPEPLLAALTPRELGVLRLVGRGLRAHEIARELGISARTVERHKQSVNAKLGASNQARAVALTLGSARPDAASGRAG